MKLSNLNNPTIWQNLYLMLFGLFLLGHLTRIQLLPNIAIYPHDILILIINIAWIIWKFSYPKLTKFPTLMLWTPAFGLIIILSHLLSDFPFFPFNSGILHGLRWINLGTLLPVTYSLCSNKLLKHTSTPLLTLSLGIALLGLIQYVLIPDLRFLYQFGWDDHLNRLVSTLLDPAFTGLILILGLILAETRSVPAPHRFILLPALLLTYSRASYITAIVIIFLLFFINRSSTRLIINLTIFALLFLLLPKSEGEGVNLNRTYSITSRVSSTKRAVTSPNAYSLLGIGFNNYQLTLPSSLTNLPNHSSSPDNSFALLLITTGIVGTSVYLYFIAYSLKWSFHHSHPVFLSLCAICIHSLTNNSLFYPYIMIWFWLLLGSELARTPPNYRS